MVNGIQPTALPLLPRRLTIEEQIKVGPTILTAPGTSTPTPTPIDFSGGGVSSREIKIFRSATTSELEQAISLLRRGKAFATRGDPRLSAIVSVLSSQFNVGEFAVTRQPTPIPTPTEIELQQSLPGDIRQLTPLEIRRGQSLIITRQLEPTEEQVELAFETRPPTSAEQLVRQTLLLQPESEAVQVGTLTQQIRPGVGEFLFGETGRPFIGFDISPKLFPSFQRADVSATQIQRTFRSVPGTLGFPVRVGAELIPTTPGEVAITGGLIGVSVLAAPIVGAGIGAGVGFLGFRTAFDPELTLEERTAGGLVGVLGGVGVVAGVTPFIRGIGARPTRIAPEGFEVIPRVSDIGDIGLIQPSGQALIGVDLPLTSPLVRGGFGRRPGGEAQFLGTGQLLATSQRGLFQVGREIPIERQFFVTPQEPGLGIPITRVSRLGLVEPFRIPESVEIGFGLPARPQIGITRGEVARTQRRGAFELGTGTELEAFRATGTITDITPLGRTRIRGQGIDIFEFQIGRPPRGRGRPRRPSQDFVSTEGTGRISGESLLGTLGIRTTRGVSLRTSALVSPLLTTGISPLISPPTTTPFIPTTLPPFSPGISPPLTPIISPPTTPTISPPTISPPLFPPISPPVRRPRDRRRKPPKKVKRKRKKARPIIRPSFTGIVLGIEAPAIETPSIGISPLQIRGLRTGLAPARRRRTIRKKKKKK